MCVPLMLWQIPFQLYFDQNWKEKSPRKGSVSLLQTTQKYIFQRRTFFGGVVKMYVLKEEHGSVLYCPQCEIISVLAPGLKEPGKSFFT